MEARATDGSVFGDGSYGGGDGASKDAVREDSEEGRTESGTDALDSATLGESGDNGSGVDETRDQVNPATASDSGNVIGTQKRKNLGTLNGLAGLRRRMKRKASVGGKKAKKAKVDQQS